MNSPGAVLTVDMEVRVKSRRQVLALAGVTALGLAAAGCSTDTSGSGGGAGSTAGSGGGSGGTLRVYVSKQTTYAAEQRDWFTRIQQAFRTQTGADVQFETYSSGTEEQQKIQTSVVSGTGPDVYEIGTTFTPTAYSTGAFLTMNDDRWKAIGGRDRFTPATLAMSGPDAQHEIGIPFTSIPFVMAYNTAMFKAAGITAPPTTWDELIADAKKLNTGGVAGLAMDYKDQYDPWKYVWMFSRQNGNPLIDGSTVTLDDPAVQKAFESYFGFRTTDGIAPADSVNWSSADTLAAFAAGKAAMLTMASTQILPTLKSSPVKDDYALATMPDVPPGASSLPAGGTAATTIVSGQNLVVADYSKSQDLALEYIKLITSDAEQKHFSDVFGVLPTNSAAADTVASANTDFAPVREAGSNAKPTPFTGAWSQVQLGLMDIVVQSLPGLSNGSVAADSIAQRLTSLQSTAQAAVTKAARQ